MEKEAYERDCQYRYRQDRERGQRRKMIVLDASVALKWIFGEEEGEERARLYKEGHVNGKETVAVHSLFFYEIANVLATKTKLSTKDAVDAFSLIWNFDLEGIQVSVSMNF